MNDKERSIAMQTDDKMSSNMKLILYEMLLRVLIDQAGGLLKIKTDPDKNYYECDLFTAVRVDDGEILIGFMAKDSEHIH